jgi:hypothetical protein
MELLQLFYDVSYVVTERRSFNWDDFDGTKQMQKLMKEPSRNPARARAQTEGISDEKTQWHY